MSRTITYYKQLLPLLCVLCGMLNVLSAQNQLKITITDVRTVKGQILFSLYKQERGYPDDPDLAFSRGAIPVNAKQITHVITDLPPGNYALSLVHDENSNNRLDKNKMGIPTECFAFSNNSMGAFGPPKFIKARFQIRSDTLNQQTIRLRKFQ